MEELTITMTVDEWGEICNLADCGFHEFCGYDEDLPEVLQKLSAIVVLNRKE